MAATGASFRPPKQWTLTENESITSYDSWKSNILYHLSLNNEFAPFLEGEWATKATANHGFVDDGADNLVRRTAAQKSILLDRMLGIIAQFVPSLLRNEIIKRSTSLDWIWKRIRKYYSFSQSEVNFLKLSTIHHMDNERYETLFQRILAHLEDNLLTIASELRHDGETPTADEVMSPTTERLAVYLWMNIIDKRLAAHISRTYAHDLQSMTLKDLQPRIAENMDSILHDMNASEEIQIHYSRSNYSANRNYQNPKYKGGKPTPPPRPPPRKVCVLCKSSGRPHMGHDAKNCWFTSKFEKQEIARALMVEVADEQEEEEPPYSETISYVSDGFSVPIDNTLAPQDLIAPTVVTSTSTIRKVQTASSPYFYAFYKHTPCHVIVDSGATSSMMSMAFVKLTRIPLKSTKHGAMGVNKSAVDLLGEVQISLHFNNMSLPITALVVAHLDCDILGGIPFCMDNDIEVHMKAKEFSIQQKRFSYGIHSNQTHNIFRVDSLLLRSDTSRVILPGEYFEVENEQLSKYEGEVSVEPHISSPKNWPQPCISRVIQGKTRIPNLSDEPVYLNRSQHFANIRRVLDESLTEIPCTQPPPPAPSNHHTLHSSRIVLDPDGQLTTEERKTIADGNRKYDIVFDPETPTYNDRFGAVRAHVTMGPVPPPPRKGRLPFYDQTKMRILQEEADKMEARGILAKPEDVGVEVLHMSPSFLLNKPDETYRFVTAFTELGQYTRITPTVSRSCDEVLRKLASYTHIIKCDMTKSFYQIKVSKKSIPFLGTVTPYKGLRVYLVSAMGQPGSSEALEELITRVFGEFIYEGWFIHIHDDINVCANDIKQLIVNWFKVLQRFLESSLRLSAHKTIICPKKTMILGWVWNSGTLSCSPHKIAPLAVVKPPATASAMRSFLGAYRAISRCIPQYASLASPLEDSMKGLQGAQKITWTPDLQQSFTNLQKALQAPQTLTVPCPSDQLVMTVDASPLNKGLSATLFIIRNQKRLLADNFSMKLKGHQIGWMPCEHEALAITAGITHFAPYVRESQHKMQILTDNRPCVQAYQKLCKGLFSASSRISTFLSTLNTNNVTVQHISGDKNTTSDYGSRHPQSCPDQSCQICTFIKDLSDSVVNAVTTTDILSGNATMPYLNTSAWKSVQHDCQTLRRLYAHLTQGTRPTKKIKNMKDIRRFLQVASVDNKGLLVVRKTDPFVTQRNLIIVPSAILPGLITAMHLYFDHATKYQLSKIVSRYFFGINSDNVISNVVEACDTCTSLKKVPNEMFTQNSTPSPKQPGMLFHTDVLRLNRQKIFVSVDGYSNFTTAALIADESHKTLRSALLSNTALFRVKPCSVRVDNAPGFHALRDDQMLGSHGVSLDFGRFKNLNKTAVADKCAQELELELLKRNPVGGPCTPEELQETVLTLNNRIRNQGLSAKEILFQRDQHTGEQLLFNSDDFVKQQEDIRSRNHLPSAISKSRGGKPAAKCNVNIGDLVFIKHEGGKTKGRERYIITGYDKDNVILQKITGRYFSAKKYVTPLTHVIPITVPYKTDTYIEWNDNITPVSDSDSDTPLTLTGPEEELAGDDNEDGVGNLVHSDASEDELPFHDASEDFEQPEADPDYVVENRGHDMAAAAGQRDQRPRRERRPPSWHHDYTFDGSD